MNIGLERCTMKILQLATYECHPTKDLWEGFNWLLTFNFMLDLVDLNCTAKKDEAIATFLAMYIYTVLVYAMLRVESNKLSI